MFCLLCCYFQRSCFWFYWFSLLFYYSLFHWISALIFGILPLFALGLVCSSCPVSYSSRSGYCPNISSLQVYIYSSKYLLSCITGKCFCVLCLHFHSTQLRTGQLILLLISLTNWLFRSMLLHFYIFVNSPSFFQLISNSVVLKLPLVFILSFLNVLRLVLWPSLIQCFLKNVSCEL